MGKIPFVDFMARALYDPDTGFYGSGRVSFGPRGDFTTSPHLSRVFSRCLAAFVVSADTEMGFPEPFALTEGGPGEGLLAGEILDELECASPDLYRRLVYVADEISRPLTLRQMEALKKHAAKVSVKPMQGMEGLYFSNELLDAFPVRVFEKRGGAIFELYVEDEGGVFKERWEALPSESILPSVRNIVRYHAGEEEPFRFEIRPTLPEWLKNTAGNMKRGYVLTIDYGDVAQKLYGPHKPEGTLRGFKNGEFAEQLLNDPGSTDLTASVDFAELIDLGKNLGLFNSPLHNQREFLFHAGLERIAAQIEEHLESEAERYSARQELWPLLFPGTGMGESFKVLIQGKNVSIPQGFDSSAD